MAQVKAGKLRAIAVTAAGRSTLAPEVPSLAEAGVPGILLDIWNAAAASASMPASRVQLLADHVSQIARAPEMRATLFQQGWQVAATSPEGLAQRIRSDTASLGRIIAGQGIRVE
jgi:tripartite-type tricarboxylate transporter receptor subunit TctC